MKAAFHRFPFLYVKFFRIPSGRRNVVEEFFILKRLINWGMRGQGWAYLVCHIRSGVDSIVRAELPSLRLIKKEWCQKNSSCRLGPPQSLALADSDICYDPAQSGRCPDVSVKLCRSGLGNGSGVKPESAV